MTVAGSQVLGGLPITNTKAVPKWTRGAIFPKKHMAFPWKLALMYVVFFVGPPPPRKGRVFPVKRHFSFSYTTSIVFCFVFWPKSGMCQRFRSKFQSLGFQMFPAGKSAKSITSTSMCICNIFIYLYSTDEKIEKEDITILVGFCFSTLW